MLKGATQRRLRSPLRLNSTKKPVNKGYVRLRVYVGSAISGMKQNLQF